MSPVTPDRARAGDGARPPAIVARGVRRSFGEHRVLDDVCLTVAEGTVFSLLGPNGAGKTTMVRILSTLIEADAGEITVDGHDLRTDAAAVRAAIGVTGQFSAVDNLLTGAENLRLMADLRHLGRRAGSRRVQELLERFELVEAADSPLSTYSGGMRRRLDLAMTLIGDPRVIFLDEPTTGLDPRSRRTMWQIIGELVADGVTILLTTQYLDEADRLADRIAVLDHGRIVAEGSPAELSSRSPVATSSCASPSRVRCAPPRRCSSSHRPPTEDSRCRCPATAASPRCAACSPGWTTRGWRSRISRSTPPTSTTSSSR